MKKKIYRVVGMFDLEDVTFAYCTSYEKALKAKEYAEANGFNDMVDIIEDTIWLDSIEINNHRVEL